MPLPGILGGFETRQKHFFFTFLELGKNRDLSEIIGIFPKNRRFFAEIFLNDFSMDFSSPLQPITEKSPKNRPIFPIFCSLVTRGKKVGSEYLCHLTFTLFKFILKNFIILEMMFIPMVSSNVFHFF